MKEHNSTAINADAIRLVAVLGKARAVTYAETLLKAVQSNKTEERP